ncbi:MAG: hypothetical protein GTO71_10455 [Woeseiaceae bacterium]|nr:hypothetical protein [Woeseiaceae bacterium]NIP21494.1 hypothetical protein [Woeseiaceae bacterium]NIS90482.1 hypothetical protein [Woeseiaceae bacterium]
MKYVVSLVLGILAGVLILLAVLYYNPLTARNTLSPLSVSDNEIITFRYSAVAADALVFTNDGESQIKPNPPKVLQLWEPTVRLTNSMVTILRDSRNNPAAIGIKISSESEKTNIVDGNVIVDSVWHIYVPGRGSLFVEQQENYWGYVREIVIPAYWSSGDSWRGNWTGNITSGPGALGTARVVGGSGVFLGLVTDGVESLRAEAYSVDAGPVAMDAELTIELPRIEATLTPDP